MLDVEAVAVDVDVEAVVVDEEFDESRTFKNKSLQFCSKLNSEL